MGYHCFLNKITIIPLLLEGNSIYTTLTGKLKRNIAHKFSPLGLPQCVKISRNKRKRQPIGMLGRSSGNHDWLLANASACVSCGFRLRNVRNASD